MFRVLLANLRGVYFFRSIAVKIFSDSVQAVMEEHFKQSFVVKTRMTDFQECIFIDQVKLKWIIVDHIVEACIRNAVILVNGNVCVFKSSRRGGKENIATRVEWSVSVTKDTVSRSLCSKSIAQTTC